MSLSGPDDQNALISSGPIDALPVEILTKIFVELSQNYIKTVCKEHNSHPADRPGYQVSSCRCLNWDPHSEQIPVWDNTDVCTRYPFPSALWDVSNRWRTITETIPSFWTRLVIFVDSNPTPLSWIARALALSAEHPLQVNVIRREHTYSCSDPDERDRCRAVIALLSPHFHRCQRIHFDVIHSSSLPSLITDFGRPCPLLHSLQLVCREDDGDAPGATNGSHSRNEGVLISPALRVLEIDGRNFAHRCRHGLQWDWKKIIHSTLTSISISNFTPSVSITEDLLFSNQDLLQFLQGMPALKSLSLSNVEFVAKREGEEWAGFVSLEVSHMVLKDLKRSVFSSIASGAMVMYGDSLQIERCEVSNFEVISPRSPSSYTILVDLDKGVNIGTHLLGWAGASLRVERCPSFNDDTLKIFAQHGCPPELLSLEICDCPNFTAKGLIRAVEKLGWMPLLRVSGQMLPEKPTAEQILWLEKHTWEFDWNVRQSHMACRVKFFLLVTRQSGTELVPVSCFVRDHPGSWRDTLSLHKIHS
ncbi:hypothetical protein H0H81_006409 [Sphagnurus paluster]|uniref:F-box domain-containing protein n=1 Tax=Sphagnurus paluster TaxID=117069 RepID=A0A9P7K7Q9_9AGAR|nr:hypothetical protein H0H81_006409 [Sphagnurus paluster]